MSLETVKKTIETGLLPPVYLWYGEDRYSTIEALQLLKRVFLIEDPSGSQVEMFSAKEVPIAGVTGSANTCSFFSRKLVVLDDFNFNDPGDDDSLLDYCRNVNPSTCLVLISEKVNRARKLFKEIARVGDVYEFSYPKNHKAWQMWVRNQAKDRGKDISPETASYLVERSGHHTGILSQELNKLIIYTGDSPEIGRDDVQRVCVPLPETTVFAMVDAIAAGKAKDALCELQMVLNQEHYLKTFAMIVRQIRLLLAAAIMREKGEPADRFMEVAGIRSPFLGNKIYRQAAGFSPRKLAGVMEECLQTELALKSSGGDPQLLLELLVIRFCCKETVACEQPGS